MRLVGYCRVSTDAQGESGLGLEAQERTIRQAVEMRGDELVTILTDVASGRRSDRDGLNRAMDMCGTEADGVVVAKTDRCTRSIQHFARIMERSKREGWRFIALDLGVDTNTPEGEFFAYVMAAYAQFESARISTRVREAHASRTARGERIERPSQRSDSGTVARLLELRSEGQTLRQIATTLTDEGYATAQGGTWRAGTVGYLLHKHDTGKG